MIIYGFLLREGIITALTKFQYSSTESSLQRANTWWRQKNYFEIANNVREKGSIISHDGSQTVSYRPKREAADDKHSATNNRLIPQIQHKNL